MRSFNGKQYEEKAAHSFDELVEIVAVLRGGDGCKWDRAQTHESLKKCLIDESQEVLEAVDNHDDENLCEELGDVLLQVLMNAQIAQERGAFAIDDVIQVLSEKLIRRHPHVFGDEVVENEEQALALWKKVKAREKAEKEEKENNQNDCLKSC